MKGNPAVFSCPQDGINFKAPDSLFAMFLKSVSTKGNYLIWLALSFLLPHMKLAGVSKILSWFSPRLKMMGSTCKRLTRTGECVISLQCRPIFGII